MNHEQAKQAAHRMGGRMRPRVTVIESPQEGALFYTVIKPSNYAVLDIYDEIQTCLPVGVYELTPVCADCDGTGEGEAVIGGERVEPGSDGWRMVQKRVLCPSCSQKDEQ